MGFFNRKPKALGDMIANAIGEYGLAEKVLLARIAEQWPQIATETVAKHVRVMKLEKGTLHLAAESPVWKQEVFMRRDKLASAINEFLNESRIKQIEVH